MPEEGVSASGRIGFACARPGCRRLAAGFASPVALSSSARVVGAVLVTAGLGGAAVMM